MPTGADNPRVARIKSSYGEKLPVNPPGLTWLVQRASTLFTFCSSDQLKWKTGDGGVTSLWANR